MLKVRIREVAQAKNLSRTQIAKRGALDYKTVQRIWNDPYKNVDLATLDRLCNALDVEPGELLERVRDVEENENTLKG